VSWFRISNNAGVPVHLAVSTAGVIQYHKNDVAGGGGYAEFNVKDAIWHDLTVVPSNGHNQIDAPRQNGWKIAEIVTGSVGILVAGAAAPFTGGASLAIAVAIGGGLVAVGTTVASIVNFAMNPATISNLYAPDGYNFTISGGEFEGHQDGSGGWVITGFKPISVKWHNNQTKREGTVVGAKK
jgi:hypothetical protein